ncbi:hypothetical protein [Vibrio neonatus]|uniref:hypothetical protein n=1 Tax=Vibrio neonatus TaxID=278860 RepID=UPI0021C4A1F8|nr:hypothetical protein [Vibrio neonatus]
MKNIFLVVALSFFMAGCVSKPVLNIEQAYVPTSQTGEHVSSESVRDAIFRATERRGWTPRVIEPGLIMADISVRSHTARVKIEYDESEYSIHYVSSQNLNYNNGTIHRNYNNWVLKLSRTIQQELGVNSQKY